MYHNTLPKYNVKSQHNWAQVSSRH